MKLKALLFVLPLLLVGLWASACPGGKTSATATAAAPACSQMKAQKVAHAEGHGQCAGMRQGKKAHMHAATTAGADMPACCKMKVTQASYSENGKACSANGNCSMTSLGLALLVSLGAIGGLVFAFTKLRI